MGDKKDKFYWFKVDKDKVKIQLKDIGSKFIPKKNNWKNISIMISTLVLIGIVIAVYIGNLDDKNGNDIQQDFATPERIGEYVEEDYSEMENEENQSKTALGYREDGKLELASSNIELDTKNANDVKDENSIRVKEDSEGQNNYESSEVTYPVGPAPTREEATDYLKINRPLQGELSQKAGWFFHPVYEDWRYQTGVILDGETGEIVKAAADGKVISVKQDLYYGLKIIIEHNDDWQTVYANLKETNLSIDDIVTSGESVGKIGEKGLYFEVRKNSNPINTEKLLN